VKQILVASLALLFYAFSAKTQQPPNPPATQIRSDPSSDELVTATKTWTQAMNDKDHAKLEALVAPGFALYRWNGYRMAQRSDWLDFIYNTEIKEYTMRDINAKAYGDFGVVTSVCTWTGVHGGATFDIHSVMVDT
jgi:hypothetical protein